MRCACDCEAALLILRQPSDASSISRDRGGSRVNADDHSSSSGIANKGHSWADDAVSQASKCAVYVVPQQGHVYSISTLGPASSR